MDGYFENGSIFANISVKGVLTQKPTLIKGMIDTGFSGYLTLPYQNAFPLGLVLQGTKAYTLADGSSSYNFVCMGVIEIDGKEEVIPIDIQPKCMVLIGTSLLKRVGCKFIVDFSKEKVSFEIAKAKSSAK